MNSPALAEAGPPDAPSPALPDLLGLPPTPEQLEFFLHDRRPDAYERLVDTLSLRHTSRRAVGPALAHLARYADSDRLPESDRPGLALMCIANWVIDAINRDLRSTSSPSSIAGICWANAPSNSDRRRVHRNTLWKHEDGVDPEEFRCKPRWTGSTTGTVWLGLTVAAPMHSH